MKLLLFKIILLLPYLLLAQNNPFSTLTYDKVVAYEFQGEGHVLIEDCLKNQPEKISNTVTLSSNKITTIETILTSEDSYGNTTAACFDPHLAIVYYHQNKIVATASICLDCNYLVSSVEIMATKKKQIQVTEDYAYPAKGFSKETRKNYVRFVLL